MWSLVCAGASTLGVEGQMVEEEGNHRGGQAATKPKPPVRHFARARGLRRPDDNTPAERSGMSIYRIYAGTYGESHMEEVHLAQHPELGALMQVARVGIHEFAELRTMDFHPLPERRLIIHL